MVAVVSVSASLVAGFRCRVWDVLAPRSMFTRWEMT